MKLYFIISLLPCLFYLLYKSKRPMHMLQQNWYNDGNRYFNWILQNPLKVFINVDLLFIIFLFLKSYPAMITFEFYFIICYILENYKRRTEQSKKPLVITPRIKRLCVTTIIIYVLYTLSFTYFNFNDNHIGTYYFYIALLVYLNWFVIMLANIINKPIEKMVFLYYKRKATNKLEQMTNLKRISITGSYGKTSTKNALNDILNVKYNSFATEKSFNTMNGLMISINNKLDKFTDIFVSEMGAFKRGEIKELCDLFHPQYGIITTIGTAHLESFGSQENIQKGKFELVDSLPEDGIAVLNMDDPYQVSYKIKSKCKVVWVSMKDKKADVYASNIKLSNKGTTFTCHFKDKKESVILETKLLGEKNVYNILEAIALSYNLGLTLDEIKTGVKRIKTVEHRLELKKFGNINIIDDAYNSNVEGSKMALDVLNLMDGKKIVCTPGMIELGEKQYEYNMEFGRHIAKVCDEVILIGEEQTKPIQDGLKKEKYKENKIHILNDVKEAFPLMRKLADGDTYVLLENDLPDIFNE